MTDYSIIKDFAALIDALCSPLNDEERILFMKTNMLINEDPVYEKKYMLMLNRDYITNKFKIDCQTYQKVPYKVLHQKYQKKIDPYNQIKEPQISPLSQEDIAKRIKNFLDSRK